MPAKKTTKARTRRAKPSSKSNGGQKRSRGAKPLISDEDRRRMIEKAAYFLAQERGFENGDPTSDWLAAEATVDQELKGAPKKGKTRAKPSAPATA